MVLQTLSEFSAFRISCVCITSACLCVLSSFFLRCERYLFNYVSHIVHLCFWWKTNLVGGFNPFEKYLSNWITTPIFGMNIKNMYIWNHQPTNQPTNQTTNHKKIIYVVFSCHSSSSSDYPIRSLDLPKLQRRSWCTRYLQLQFP